jgi:hypothetical protein
LGIPPIIRKKIDAITYLMKTIKVGEKLTSKFLTIKNVEPKNNAEKNNAIRDLFLSVNNI